MLLLPSPKESSNYFLTKSYSRFLASAPPRMSWGDGANPQTLRTSSMSLGCWTSRHWALVLEGMVLGILRDNQQPSVYSSFAVPPPPLPTHFSLLFVPLALFFTAFFPLPKILQNTFPFLSLIFCCFCTSYSFFLLASISSH